MSTQSTRKGNVKFPTEMKATTIAIIAAVMCVGVAVANYGGGYMPISGGSYAGSYGGGLGGIDNSFLYIICFLFLIFVLFQSDLFNSTFFSTSSSSTTPISIVQG